MAIGLLQEFEADLGRYDELTAKLNLDTDPPQGLIVHTVGEAGGRVRLFDVWKSEEDWERFRDERLNPALEAVASDSEALNPRTEVYPLHDLFPG